MARSSQCFDPGTRERLRRRLLERRQLLGNLLADVVRGKDRMFVLRELGLVTPGLRPVEVLQRALAQVERRRLQLISDDERYDCCESCGGDLGAAMLREVPWADRCPVHAS